MKTNISLKNVVTCFASIFVLTSLGCQELAIPNSQGMGDAAQNGTTANAPISDEEAVTFAVELEKSLRENSGMFPRVMDWQAITDTVLRDLPKNRTEGAYRRRDLLASLTQSGGMAQHITEKLKRGGAYHYLRMKLVPDSLPGEKILMFRYIDPDGGLDYHHLYLHRAADGTIGVREIFMFHFGETYTDSIRQTLAPELYVGGSRSYSQNLPPVRMSEVVQIHFRENMQAIQAMFTAYEKNDFHVTLNIYDALPEELQAVKSLRILRLNAAMRHADPNVYLFVLADLRQKMQGEPCIDFLSLDYLFSRGHYGEVLLSMDRIDAIIGTDPYLNLFRCMALVNLGRSREAQELYSLSVQADPRLKYDLDFSRFAPPETESLTSHP